MDRKPDDTRRQDRAAQHDVAHRAPHSGEPVNSTAEDEYWRSNWSNRPYVDRNRDYDFYRPAYRLGWESRVRYGDREWHEVEAELATSWRRERERTTLKWDEARLAARDAWRRVGQRQTGEGRR